MNFERGQDPVKSLKIGMREKCVEITSAWFKIGIYYNEDMKSIKHWFGIMARSPKEYLQLMTYLAKEEIPLNEFMSLIEKLPRKERKQLRRSKKEKLPIRMLVELSISTEESIRIMEMHEYMNDAPGIILEKKIYPISKEKTKLTY